MILELFAPTNSCSLLDFLQETITCHFLLALIMLPHFSHERTTQWEIQSPKVFHVGGSFAPQRRRRRAHL